MTRQVVTISDEQAGSRARITTGFGFNCFEFTIPWQNGTLDLLWSEDSFATGPARASGSGIPLLFPFPGRMPGETFRFEGRSYQLKAGDGRGNAIHGFVLDRPWELLEQTDQSVTGRFHASRVDPGILESWPADFCLTARYELSGTRLSLELHIENPDDKPLPCGLGTHPYFRLPLGGNSAEDCRVQLPVTEEWELEEMLPTGNRGKLSDNYRTGRPFGELQLDNVFCGLELEENRIVTRITDPGSKLEIVQEFDPLFRECVVYTPPHREAICIEPYTCLPGGFELQQTGTDAGMRVLAPGESLEARVDIYVRS